MLFLQGLLTKKQILCVFNVSHTNLVLHRRNLPNSQLASCVITLCRSDNDLSVSNLVSSTKSKVKEIFIMATTVSDVPQNQYLNRRCLLSKMYEYTSSHDCCLCSACVAPASQVTTSTMLLLVIAGI
jgi:hypothetical protein